MQWFIVAYYKQGLKFLPTIVAQSPTVRNMTAFFFLNLYFSLGFILYSNIRRISSFSILKKSIISIYKLPTPTYLL